MRLDRPCEKPASESAGDIVRADPVCARGRDADEVGRGRFAIGGVASGAADPFDVMLLVRCLEENVDPKSVDDELAPDIGPDTERVEETDIRLELRVCVPVLTDEPDAARRVLTIGSGGARNLGDADSFEKLPFLSRLCRGRGTSRLARILGLSVGLLM